MLKTITTLLKELEQGGELPQMFIPIDLESVLKVTRQEPGITIQKVAETIKQVYSTSEIKSLVKELNENI